MANYSIKFGKRNEKGADETVEVEIKGLFDGHNSGGVSAAQELYENTLITDIHTAAKVYGNTEDTAVYQDATFFVKGDKNLDSVIKDLGKLDINWREYNLIKHRTIKYLNNLIEQDHRPVKRRN
ncbi:hypothetical protein EfmJHP36_32400 (plasmid) [Enterococcus faecium]|nr:hypothetical protein EfmJHP36_32400 [Enterococcus faecium]